MKQLLEDYQRRLKTINGELTRLVDEASDTATITRLIIKRGCYRTFISELERLVPSTPESTISKEEQLAIDKADFEKWRIENDKKNEEFMRRENEKEERDRNRDKQPEGF
jgi:hypothetical protein